MTIGFSNNNFSQVDLSSEESEESQKEEEVRNLETTSVSCDASSKAKKEKPQVKDLSNLTSSQLEAIIGGSLNEYK